MMDVENKVYIGTVLLEKNRWVKGRPPSFRVSEWIGRFREAGFDGMDLWENHAALCGEEELAKIEAAGFPVAVFNAYAGFEDAEAEVAERETSARLAARLCAQGVKFNVGKHPELRATYLRNVREWKARLPAGIRVLCECHPGTILQKPDAAAAALAEWDDPRVQVIVHAFGATPADLRAWFAALDPAITHVHVQMQDENRVFRRLERRPAQARETLRILRDEGFRGSFSLEFTEGTAAPEENMESLFQSALADLLFLRENMR